MKAFFPLTLLTSSLILISPAWAFDWILVDLNVSGEETYVDTSSIQRTGDQVEYWTEVRRRQDRQLHVLTTAQMRGDCVQQSIQTLQIVSDGTILPVVDSQEQMAKPGSRSATVLDYVCKLSASIQ